MARRRLRGRRSAANFAKKRFAWSRALFDENIDMTGSPGDLLELVLLDPATDIVPTANADYNRKWNVRRIIVRGQYTCTPLSSAAAPPSQAVIREALYIIDREDADGTLNDTALGSIYEGGVERCLYTNLTAFGVWEIVIPSTNLLILPRCDCDWRGNAKVGLDDMVSFGVQSSIDTSATIQAVAIHLITSVLFEAT